MRYLWSKGDYAAMSEYLYAVNWSELFTTNFTPDDIWSAFCQHLNDAINLFVPSVEVRPRRALRIRRYPRHVRRLLARKLTVWRAYKANRKDELLQARFEQLTLDCRDAIRKHEMYLENKVVNSNNVGAFYKHVNKHLSNRSNIGALTTPSGDTALNDAEKAEVLNNFFGSVCTHDDGINPQFSSRIAAGDDGISSVAFDEAKLLAAVRRIKTKCQTSSGPDGYPIMLLKNTMHVLARPLSQMYNSFVSVGKMPTAWKTANVTPIYKKGPSSDPANYRPISQTSVYCKLMERVIVADVTAYMREKGFISKHQHGFLNGRSTTTNLLESLSDWTFAIDNRLTQTVVYVDFSRAFDTVSRPKLMTKLQGYGVKGELLQLIEDFLTGRQQRTRVGKCLSNSVSLTSGIVQGSCMGPLLFLLFINDLAGIFDPEITPKLYADDIKLYASLETNIDSLRLQQNLDRLVSWANTWQLSISIKKCNTLHLSTNQNSNPASYETFHINSELLPNVETVSDLGVVVDAELKFSAHISQMTRKAHARSKLLMKSFVSHDISTLVKAFKVYVRPILEYASTVWSPHLIMDIESIEAVQRRFTKRLPGQWNVPYTERLKTVGLERLDVRRLRQDLIMTYKILFGLTCLDSLQFFELNPRPSTRGHDYKLFMPNVATDTRKYVFSSRVLHAWNNLPPDAINFRNIKCFRASLDRADLTKYCIDIY